MNAIVVTTINEETKAIKEFKRFENCNLYIIGDNKTPAYNGVTTIEDQERLDFNIIAHMPYASYSRKMIGYLLAAQNGAEVIYETDDDNIPYGQFPVTFFANDKCATTLTGGGFVNAYKWFTDKKIWPRGYPLERILGSSEVSVKQSKNKVGIWQTLADGDPDVDAVYRLTIGENIIFNKNEPLVFSNGCYCPFNSQSTFWLRELLPLMYLPAFVNMRFTDILRGYVAQCIMQKFGYSLGFSAPLVYQERNEHNLIRDFQDELDCYVWSEQLPNIINAAIISSETISNALYCAYYSLAGKGIVTTNRELALLNAWLLDTKYLIK